MKRKPEHTFFPDRKKPVGAWAGDEPHTDWSSPDQDLDRFLDIPFSSTEGDRVAEKEWRGEDPF